MSNYFLQYFLNLCILFVYKFNPNLHNHSKTLGSRKEVLHSFDAEKHLKKVKYSYLCGQMNIKPASLWLIVTQNISRTAASFASNIWSLTSHWTSVSIIFFFCLSLFFFTSLVVLYLHIEAIVQITFICSALSLLSQDSILKGEARNKKKYSGTVIKSVCVIWKKPSSRKAVSWLKVLVRTDVHFQILLC